VTGIMINSQLLNVAGAKADVTAEFDLTEYLPEGVELLDGEESLLKVTLKVEKVERKAFVLTAAELKSVLAMVGMQSGLEYTVSDEAGISVVLEGLQEDLNRMDASDLNLQIDVSGLEKGTHEVRVSVRVDSAFEIKETGKVTVIVSERTEGESGDARMLPREETE